LGGRGPLAPGHIRVAGLEVKGSIRPRCAGWKTAGVVDDVWIERIDPNRHDRSAFGCGVPAVDSWLRYNARSAGRRVRSSRSPLTAVGWWVVTGWGRPGCRLHGR
jgi:hypothetical protein